MRKNFLIVVLLAMVGAWLFAETRLGDVVMKDVVVLEPVDKTNLVNMIVAATNSITVAEADPIAIPRITAVEGRTNNWNTAHTHSQTAHNVTQSGGFHGGAGSGAVQGAAIGSGAFAQIGGAVGWGAGSFSGGAIGRSAQTYSGGAVGLGAQAGSGGAVGSGAKTGAGFAGGKEATTLDMNDNDIDAIQLGTGNNPNPGTVRFYGREFADAAGNIPLPRMSANLAPVAVTGDYTDLVNAPNYPSWPSVDIATNITWTVVVSNGHWLVYGTPTQEEE